MVPRGLKTSSSGNYAPAFSAKSPTRQPTPTIPSSASGRYPRREYQYYEPIRVDSSSCLVACHQPEPGGSGTYGAGTQVAPSGQVSSASTEPLSQGDVMYVAKLTIPTGPIQSKLNRNTAILISTAIITAFLAMVASYVIVRYVIVKPLRHLRDVSDAISRGNIALRAEIHTGDEFEELAVAFNRMLRHLVTAQEELRQVNTDLDGKVDELAQANMRLYEMNTRQERLPGHHEPRAAHAAEQHPRLQRRAGLDRPRWTRSRNATCRTSRSRAACCWK